jgi:hypothetical protein
LFKNAGFNPEEQSDHVVKKPVVLIPALCLVVLNHAFSYFRLFSKFLAFIFRGHGSGTVFSLSGFPFSEDSGSGDKKIIKILTFLEKHLQLSAGLQQDCAYTKYIQLSVRNKYTFYRKGYIGSEDPEILLNVSWQGGICI